MMNTRKRKTVIAHNFLNMARILAMRNRIGKIGSGTGND
jgi:hypothetical protein